MIFEIRQDGRVCWVRDATRPHGPTSYLKPDNTWWNSGNLHFFHEISKNNKEFIKHYFNSTRWAIAFVKKHYPDALIEVRTR